MCFKKWPQRGHVIILGWDLETHTRNWTWHLETESPWGHEPSGMYRRIRRAWTCLECEMEIECDLTCVQESGRHYLTFGCAIAAAQGLAYTPESGHWLKTECGPSQHQSQTHAWSGLVLFVQVKQRWGKTQMHTESNESQLWLDQAGDLRLALDLQSGCTICLFSEFKFENHWVCWWVSDGNLCRGEVSCVEIFKRFLAKYPISYKKNTYPNTCKTQLSGTYHGNHFIKEFC